MQYTFSVWRMAFFLLLFSALWLVVLRVPFAFAVLSALLCAIVFLWFVPMSCDSDRMQLFVEDWVGFFSWAGEAFIRILPAPSQQYLDRALLLISLGTALLTGLLVRFRTHPAVFLLVGGSLFFVQETLMQMLVIPPFLLFLAAFSLYAFRQTYGSWRRWAAGAMPRMRFLGAAVPLCLLAVLLAMLMPVRDTALGQPVMDLASELGFSFSSDGMVEFPTGLFSHSGLRKRGDNDELGGPLRGSNTLLLTIKAVRAPYLKSYTYNKYTGRSWSVSEEADVAFERMPQRHEVTRSTMVYYMGTGVMLPTSFPHHYGTMAGGYQRLSGSFLYVNRYADSRPMEPPLDKLFDINPNEYARQTEVLVQTESGDWILEDLGEWVLTGRIFVDLKPGAVSYDTMQITFEKMRTRSLFAPMEAVDLRPGEEDALTLTCSRLGDMRMQDAKGTGFSYELELCNLNLTRDELGDLLRLGGRGFLDGVDVPEGERFGFLFDTLLPFARWDAQNASDMLAGCDLPDTVPKRVYDLAMSLTFGKHTDYDCALAIETYLRTSFPYDTDVPETPADRDFVDYFLFDLQRGYCTYFATAMTVMCRSVGLKARYVEGFAPERGEEEGTFYATGEQAHAWCEVYFPGFGWIPFEPTGGSLGRTFEERNFTEDPSAPPAPSVSPGMPWPDNPEESDMPYPSFDPLDPDGDAGWTPPAWLWVIAAMLMALCATPAVHAFRRSLLRRGIPTPERAVVRIFARACALAHHMGVAPPHMSETPLEWAHRADDLTARPAHPYSSPSPSPSLTPSPSSPPPTPSPSSPSGDNGNGFVSLADAYCRLRCGPGDISVGDVQKLYAMWEKQKPPSKDRGFVYLWRRHYLGRL